MSARPQVERHAWWASLRHGGLLIAPSKLEGRFPDTLPDLPYSIAAHLRRDLVRLRAGGDGALAALLDTVFHEVLELHAARWIAGSAVDASWTRVAVTGEAIRPRRVWLGPHDATLAVFVADKEETAKGSTAFAGRGRRAVARVVEWLRKTGRPVAVLVLGRALRLVHAGTDHEAFCEWDTDLWMQEGGLGSQVDALRALLHRDALTPPKEGEPSPLVAAIQATRQGQAELSAALGERVRTAVEALIASCKPALDAIDGGDRPDPSSGKVARRDLYIAATRMIMRCVVLLFAESREGLLPRQIPAYEESYGITGLRAELQRRGHGRAEQLRYGHSAWARLLALFSLIHRGSAHEALPVAAYGGGLFEPGDPLSSDPVSRAVSAFEGEGASPSDAVVHAVLELLCVAPVRVRQGKSTRWVKAPVDFSDLSSEYIGILYEGLLDFELRRADEAIVFLRLGDEPALPLDRLDKMTNQELSQLLGKLAEKKKKDAGDDEESTEDEEEAEDENGEEGAENDVQDAEEAESDFAGDAVLLGQEEARRLYREPVQIWAERAVQAAKLVPYPKKDIDPLVRDKYQRDVAEKARWLVKRAVMPGEWFLVRWGGTRKGSGTFYTRPQLARPIVRRALQPLAYEAVHEEKDDATGAVKVTEWAPKKPEAILQLKVCDPAMGSGSFLISALRYLTSALYESLHAHGRLLDTPGGTIPKLADGLPAESQADETLPVRRDHPDFEARLRGRLKRYVVERCLYGVDLDPLAVELARMALWLETMDRELPFGFLDHKLKVGNSLVGCWFDRFQEYPILAWDREGGDKGHDRFVHHYREFTVARGKDKGKTKREGDKWTSAIKERRDTHIKPDLVRWIDDGLIRRQKVFDFLAEGKSAEVVHDEAMRVLEKLHALPVTAAEEREKVYREEILKNPALVKLREAFDTWCALWFWPGDEIAKAPGPYELLAPGEDARAVVRRVREEMRFFHWELEFPDVFAKVGSGFDAVVGNPPWETQKPNSLEFFSNLDPLYRTYTKQEALKKQTEYFETVNGAEDGWIRYSARFKGMSNWTRSAADPCGLDGESPVLSLGRGKDGEALLKAWRKRVEGRKGYADSQHPFRHQGSADINTYKMFLEMAHASLAQDGALGFLVPSGLYTDNGSRDLRKLFLEKCRWTHLYAFQNERFVFEGIHHSFKMALVNVRKGGSTEALQTRFRLGPGDSPETLEIESDAGRSDHFLSVPINRISQLSPHANAILEIRTGRDLLVLTSLYAKGAAMGDEGDSGWQVRYGREFDMTNDSKLLTPRPLLEIEGYHQSPYGVWNDNHREDTSDTPNDRASRFSLTVPSSSKYIGKVALPLYEGRMISQYDFSEKAWVRGRGRTALWSAVPWTDKRLGPQFLVRLNDAFEAIAPIMKVGMMDVTSSTNARTMIATLLGRVPCGNKVPTLRLAASQPLGLTSLLGIVNSFTFDYQLRMRLGGASLVWAVLRETSLPRDRDVPHQLLRGPVASLSLGMVGFAEQWLALVPKEQRTIPWRKLWAVTPHERLRLRCILDAVVAALYGLDENDFRWILRDCDHPVAKVTNKPFSRTLDPKGFWRVDKEKDPELRHTVLSLVAFRDMQSAGGIEPFLALNDGEGWMLPDTLCLADYGLGHDDRARSPQPVASHPSLQERFYDWQLSQTVEESWQECERHAENIRKILGLPAPSESAPASPPEPDASASDSAPAAPPASNTASPQLTQDRPIDAKTGQVSLFGEPGAQRTLDGREERPGAPKRRRR